jgi:hypothetical protein
VETNIEDTSAKNETAACAADMFGGGSVRNSPPLHRAARWGDRARVLELLASSSSSSSSSTGDGGIIDAPDNNGSTPLMWASQFGKDDVVRLLLARGADATRRNRFGWSALEYASTSVGLDTTFHSPVCCASKHQLMTAGNVM